MATLQIDVQSQNRARRELLDLRQQVQDINVQLTKNATEYQKADDAQKEKLRTDRTELSLSRRRLQNSAAQVRIYQAEAREIERLAREKQKLNRVSNFLGRTFRDLRFHLVGLFTNELLFGITQFTSSIIRIGSETETARATLRQFTDDVDGTFERLERESQALVNIDLSDIIFSFTQLRGAGADADDSITLIRGFSKSLAELGVTSGETARFMTQLRQSFSANAIEGDDVKSLIEVMPTFLDRASRSLGIQVDSWKNLQDAIDESGKSVREFYVDLARQQDIESAGADIDTFRAQTQLLREEWQGFQRDLAEQIIPALTQLIKTVRSVVFNADEQSLTISVGLPDLSDEETRQLRLLDIQETRKRLNEDIAALEARTGTSLDDIVNSSLEVTAELKAQREALGGGFASRGVVERIRRDLNEQVTIRNKARELQEQLTALAQREADAQERITQAIVQRPTPTSDLAITQITEPSQTFTPRDTIGPFGLEQPSQEFGGLGRRPVFRRPLSELGPRPSDIERIPAPLLGSAGARPVVRPQFPVAEPSPNLRGADSIDIRALEDDARLFREGQRASAQPRPSDIAAFIPVDDFEEALDGIERNYEREQRLQREILRGRRAFQRDLDREVADRERVSRGLIQTGVESVFGLTEIPTSLLGISESAAEQRLATAEQAASEIESIERSAQRRIEDIQNDRLLGEQQRSERILQIQQDLADRKEDIEANYAARILEIEAQTANQRSNFYFQFAQSAINDLNRVIQRELILRLVRDLSAALPGGIGTGLLAVASLGLTAASTGISAAQTARAESLAREQQSRFESGTRSDTNFELTIRNDDGSVRRQNKSAKRVDNEGRSAR